MKNIKTFIIGFLSCACLFLIVGATDYDREESQIGRYQITALSYDDRRNVFAIDTENGQLYRFDVGGYKWYE